MTRHLDTQAMGPAISRMDHESRTENGRTPEDKCYAVSYINYHISCLGRTVSSHSSEVFELHTFKGTFNTQFLPSGNQC